MTQSKISPPENIPQNNRARDVYRYSLITAGVMAAATVAIRYLFGAPPNYYDVNYWAGVISLVALLSAWLSKRGQTDLGLGLLIASIQAAVIIPSIKNDGLAVAFSAVGVISTFSFSYLIKSRRLAVFTNFASLAIAALLLSLDFFRPFERIPNTDVVSTWIVAGGVILVYLAIIARQAWSGNIRVKLITAFVAIIVLGLGINGWLQQLSYQTNLTNNVGDKLAVLANAQGAEIATTIGRDLDILKTLALNEEIQNAVQTVNTTSTLSQANIDRLDQQWKAADAANNNNDPLVAGVLNNQAANELRKVQSQFGQNVEVFLTGSQGFNIASTNRTSNYNQTKEAWWLVAYRDGLYIGRPEYDESSKTFAILMAVAVHKDGDSETLGVLRTTVSIKTLGNTLSNGLFGKTGRTIILLPSGQALLLKDTGAGTLELVEEDSPRELVAVSQSDSIYQRISLNGVPVFASIINMKKIGNTEEETQTMSNLNWQVVTIQDEVEALEPVTAQTRSAIILGAIIMALGIITAIFIARAISNPVIRLTAMAQKIAGGDLTATAKVETRDEVGTLAATFNFMITQLRETFATLEQRVADRTRNLELAAEVGRTVSQVRALDVMLKDATELIRKQFDLYYVQIYLVNSSQTYLNLQAGTGQVGEQLLERSHRLAIDLDSINGRAAIEKKSVVISDTTSSATFKPNPLLPDTQSEMAVPLVIGDRAVGVLDIQSEHKGSLSQNELPAFEALAGQIAVAIQNANLLAETEKARAEVEKQAASLVRTNWQDYQDAVHQPESTGFIFDHNKVIPFTEAQEQSQPNADNSFNAPVAITGETLGILTVKMGTQSQFSQPEELANAVARQVAQRIEALRLVESAERYRAEAEAASRRLTREAWKSHAENAGGHPKYLYDLKEVRPFNYSKADDSATSVPLKVRDEVIGKLGIHGLDPNDQAALELVNATVERLGAHIESLRQFDQTQSALTQSEKLFEASRELAQSPDLQGLIKASVTSLDIPEIDRAILGALQYDPEGNLEGMTIIANWSSQEEPQATPVGTRYSKEVLNTISLFSSPEPLFFDDMLQDERVDAATLGIAKYLNYRAVAALPLYVGKRQDAILLFEGEKPHHFTQAEIQLFAALAPQIATVTENRRQFERTKQQAEREATLNVISQKIQNATSVDDVLQIAARELGSALGAARVSANIQTTQQDAANVNKN